MNAPTFELMLKNSTLGKDRVSYWLNLAAEKGLTADDFTALQNELEQSMQAAQIELYDLENDLSQQKKAQNSALRQLTLKLKKVEQSLRIAINERFQKLNIVLKGIIAKLESKAEQDYEAANRSKIELVKRNLVNNADM